MINLSKNSHWDRILAAADLLRILPQVKPDAVPEPGQVLDDPALLELLAQVAECTGMSAIASGLEGPLSEWTATAIAAAGRRDFEQLREALQVMDAEGEPSLFSGFHFWPVAQSWDWLAEDFINGYLPMIVAFALQGWLGEFVSEEAELAELEAPGAGPALALSLQPYLKLKAANWDDYGEIAAQPLQALLACYFDYTDSLFLGDASRDEAGQEFITWEDAPRLVADYYQAEPVWDARPDEGELSDPWFIFRQAVMAFPLAEKGTDNDERQ